MRLKYSILLICFLCATTVAAQHKNATPAPEKLTEESISFFDYIQADSISKITMVADFTSIRKNKYKEEYYDGELKYMDEEDNLQILPVSFRTRGNSRKKLCYHPSLKLKIKKKELESRGLNKDNKYKMVCQCNSGKAHQQSLLREFLAYKIYNLISPNSYQVYLLEINYEEKRNGRKNKRFGFLLESKKSIEKRLNGKIIEREEMHSGQISRTESLRMSLFQYMIANTDWNVPALHNVKLLLDKNNKLIPIPYDYDYSGLAKAPYAIPNPDYPIKSLTERYFLSENYTRSEINEQLIYFHQQKKAIHAMVDEFGLLSRWSKRFANRFINDFYKTIENPKKVARHLIK